MDRRDLTNDSSWKRGISFLEEKIRQRAKLFSHLSASAIAVIFVGILVQFDLDGFRGLLLDGMIRLRGPLAPNPSVVLVAYDNESSRRYDGMSKLPAEEIMQIVDLLADEHPLALAILSPIHERYYSANELQMIGKALSRLENSFIGYTDDESMGRAQPPALGLPSGRYLPGIVSRDSISYGADSVSRRVMVSIDGFQTVYSRIACLVKDPLNFEICQTGHRYEHLGSSIQTFTHWAGPGGTYPTYSSLAVANHRLPRGTFQNKIVLFGTELHSRWTLDYILTPFSRKLQGTTMLEGAANGIATLIEERGIVRSKQWVTVLLTLLVGILTANMVLFLSPLRGILFFTVETLTLLTVGYFLFSVSQYWLDVAHPLLMAGIGYYLVIPYRLLDEYRKRWHYQEKSELMAQLEQLKSNFLSLVSHDLKTPVARIQGSAELLMADEKLSEKQRKTLGNIVHTTEDLSEYVESVLDLTRIESAKVPLQKATRDINSTVNEVIESKRFLAQEKNIVLKAELEPLFSFRFDQKLIRRVLSNILENAIKYSPENTTITLSSKEEAHWIRVKVKDEGYGIPSEDQEKVFQKFYRIADDARKDIKGTGLGLYLVKYFVELHEGLVELKSELGKGSEFTVSLPV